MAKKLFSTYVQEGSDILLPVLTEFVGTNMKSVYGSSWWDEVLSIFYDHNRGPVLPTSGSDDELLDSLDFSRCIKIMQWRWKDVFSNHFGSESNNCSNYVHELLAVRNSKGKAHIGRRDIEQCDAERALDTMIRLCRHIDMNAANQIKEIYKVVRNGGDEFFSVSGPVPVDIPSNKEEADIPFDAINNLMDLIGTELVKKTTLTKKLTIGGVTRSYPVYKVRIDKLFYNDQNDRVATWFSRYCAEKGIDSLSKLDREEYNSIVEEFVVESNPDALRKTQKSILRHGQQEAGVTLSDGRIVDGNRRYTCLRRIERETTEEMFFETVLLDSDLETDKKKIKMLELAIQHGEEKRVDYDLIDYAIGTYNDVVKSPLLTIEEYANCTEEPVSEVQKRIEIAKIIVEFVEYLRVPKQYYIAREYQVYSVFDEMMPILNLLNVDEQHQLKRIVFNNVLLQANRDQRKFIRDIKGLIKGNDYQEYFDDQREINDLIHAKFDMANVTCKSDLDTFSDSNAIIREKLRNSIERFLQLSKDKRTILKPIENVAKSVSLMADVDENVFDKMNAEEKNDLLDGINRLSNVIGEYSSKLGTDPLGKPLINNTFKLAKSRVLDPNILCKSVGIKISSLEFCLQMGIIRENEKENNYCEARLFFINEDNELVSDIQEVLLKTDEELTCRFKLINNDYTETEILYLVIQSTKDKDDEALRVIPFEIDIY